jgi:hypothetical protein
MITGTVRRESPRCQTWLHVFGSTSVPLESPAAVSAWSPEGVLRPFYRVSVQALDAEQRERVVSHLAGAWNLEPAEIERLLDDPKHGLPILADDVIVQGGN